MKTNIVLPGDYFETSVHEDEGTIPCCKSCYWSSDGLFYMQCSINYELTDNVRKKDCLFRSKITVIDIVDYLKSRSNFMVAKEEVLKSSFLTLAAEEITERGIAKNERDTENM